MEEEAFPVEEAFLEEVDELVASYFQVPVPQIQEQAQPNLQVLHQEP